MIKIYEIFKITRETKYSSVIYTEDMQTFYAIRYRNARIIKKYELKLHEKASDKEISKAQLIIPKETHASTQWRLMKMLLVIAIVHAKMRHKTRNFLDIYKMIETTPKIRPKMIMKTIKEYEL